MATRPKHTVYKSGMSDWCANCHDNLHSDNTSNFIHPIGQLGSTIAALYNSYVSTDDVTGGNVGTSYMGLVPFEVVNVDLSTVNSENYTMGPDGAAEVMCLTCHRAHASAYQDATRWDMSETFLVDSHPNPGDIDFVQSDVDHKDYDYIFPANQRSLCNKCHQKDFGDTGLNEEVGLTPAENPQYGGSKYPARRRG